MRRVETPAVATWILRHFGSSPNNESIIGDLAERFQGRQSRLWYWRQVILAVVVGLCRELRGNKLIAVRALFIALVIKIGWTMLGRYEFAKPRGWFRHAYVSSSVLPIFLIALATCLICASSAWFIARISRPHEKAMVLLYLVTELLGWPTALWLTNMTAGPAFWTPTFSGFVQVGLTPFGFVSSIAATWCGSLLVAMTILLGGGVLRPSATNDSYNKTSDAV